MSISNLVRKIRDGELSAEKHCLETIQNLKARDSMYHAVTRVLEDRAITAAKQLDQKIASGRAVGSLAGVPFGVKDLFDVQGLVTTAGSITLNNNAPASNDAEVVRRLCAEDAIPVATLNMDEFAYGFATENAHYGTTCNPHDTARLAGGSSGGSAAAVAAGMLPFTLGSDTNGSIRVPASLCGVWGLRPTQGLLPLSGVYPFAASLDVIGPFAQSVADIRVVTEVMAGRKFEYKDDVDNLKVGLLGGWFAQDLSADLQSGMQKILQSCPITCDVTLPEADKARAASFVITAAEGGNLHLPRLKTTPMAYDPATRDRLMAGALLPASTVIQAQRLRNWFRDILHSVFNEVDILMAPATVGIAPRLDQPTIMVGGKAVSARANLGLFTQPLSLAGMPVLSAPLPPSWEGNQKNMPLGVQFIAAPGKENMLLAFAEKLERSGLLGFPVASH